MVNRALLQDAQVIFFSGNRFVVHDFQISFPLSTPGDFTFEFQGEGEDNAETRPEGSEYHSDRLAASAFLRDKVPLQMLRELRELEFVFPPYRHTGWPGEGHPALTDWVETLVWARYKMSLGALAVRLVMADSVASFGPPSDRRDLTSEQVEDILSAYRRIISPLAILAQPEAKGVVGRGGDDGELLSFHAKVAWPLAWRWDSEDN